MQGEDIFLGQNDFGKIFILLNSLKKSGFREKRKKNSLRCFSLRRYPLRRLLTILTFVNVKFTSIVHV